MNDLYFSDIIILLPSMTSHQFEKQSPVQIDDSVHAKIPIVGDVKTAAIVIHHINRMFSKINICVVTGEKKSDEKIHVPAYVLSHQKTINFTMQSDCDDSAERIYAKSGIEFSLLRNVLLNYDAYISSFLPKDKKIVAKNVVKKSKEKTQVVEMKKELVVLLRVYERNSGDQKLTERIADLNARINHAETITSTSYQANGPLTVKPVDGTFAWYMSSPSNANKMKEILRRVLYTFYKPICPNQDGKTLNLAEEVSLTYEALYRPDLCKKREEKEELQKMEDYEIRSIYKLLLPSATSSSDSWRDDVKQRDNGELLKKFISWVCAKVHNQPIRVSQCDEENFTKWYNMDIHCLDDAKYSGSQRVTKDFNSECDRWNNANKPRQQVTQKTTTVRKLTESQQAIRDLKNGPKSSILELCNYAAKLIHGIQVETNQFLQSFVDMNICKAFGDDWVSADRAMKELRSALDWTPEMCSEFVIFKGAYSKDPRKVAFNKEFLRICGHPASRDIVFAHAIAIHSGTPSEFSLKTEIVCPKVIETVAAIPVVEVKVEEEEEKPQFEFPIIPLRTLYPPFLSRAWLESEEYDGHYDDLNSWSFEAQIRAREQIDQRAKEWFHAKRARRQHYLCPAWKQPDY